VDRVSDTLLLRITEQPEAGDGGGEQQQDGELQ